MSRIIVIVLVVAGVAYFLMNGSQQKQQAKQQEHAELTKMALESEAKVKQAATLANKDQVAEFEKQDQ